SGPSAAETRPAEAASPSASSAAPKARRLALCGAVVRAAVPAGAASAIIPRRGRSRPLPRRFPQAERPGPGPGRPAGPAAPGATSLESAAREPDRSVGGRPRRQAEADAGLVVLEPELVRGAILDALRARQRLARMLVGMLGHDVLGAQEDVGA